MDQEIEVIKCDQELDLMEEVKGEVPDSANAHATAVGTATEAGVTDDHGYYQSDEDEMSNDLGQAVTPDLNAIRANICQLKSSELEEFVVKKVMETINAKTLIGKFKAEYLHLHGLKDQLFAKTAVLQKQVSELKNALQIYEENETKTNPDDRRPKVQLESSKSVGIQVGAKILPRMRSSGKFVPRMSNSNAFKEELSLGEGNESSKSLNDNGNVQQEQTTPIIQKMTSSESEPTNSSLMASVIGSSNPNFTLPKFPEPTTRVPYRPEQISKSTQVLPGPILTLEEKYGEIVLSWTHRHRILKTKYSDVVSYEIFVCKQPLELNYSDSSPAWEKVKDMLAMPLPMIWTFSQVSDANRYHFIVRGIDEDKRSGKFSQIESITFKKRV